MAQKEYGLIKPQKPAARLSAFDSDSDSDDEPASKKKVFTGMGESQKRQARLAQENALKEDPTIYQYDELYDDINNTREEAKKAKTSQVKSSKYIERLLVTADKRKKEYERRIERQVQKERQAEGDMYKDKETFVTATYRAKLEEMKMADEADRREEYLENIGDVTKQRDLGGFYRHLYEQKMGTDKKIETATSDDTPKSTEETSTETKVKEKKQRTYRKRLSNENEEEDAAEESNLESEGVKTHLPSNIDADSDFSIDSDSDEDTAENKTEPKPKSDKPEVTAASDVVVKTETETAAHKKQDHEFTKPDAVDKKDVKEVKDEVLPEVKPVKIKIDIWKKRTVGDVFDSALQRYYERKETRVH